VNETLTRSGIVDAVHQHGLGYTKRELHSIVNSVFEIMNDNFEEGNPVKLSGFGNFTVVNKAARVGRNPQTDESIIISRRRILNFKPSNMLRDAVTNNKNGLL
jgi:integration host factor subunit alpha